MHDLVWIKLNVFIVNWNLDGLVSTAIHYGLDGFEFRIPAGVRGFLSCMAVLNDSRVHLFDCYRGSFPRIKRPWSEVDHTCAPSAEVKNEWNYSSTPLYILSWRVYTQLYLHLFYAISITATDFETKVYVFPFFWQTKTLIISGFKILMTLQIRWTEDC